MFIILLGLILSVLAVMDISKKNITFAGKIICSLVVLLTSWAGFIVYFLWAKDHVTEWFK